MVATRAVATRAANAKANTKSGTRLHPSAKHGGRRHGAGRKKQLAKAPNHVPRGDLDCRHPVHVGLRTVRGMPRLRQSHIYQVIRRVLALYLELDDFRVVHISIQRNHLHFIVEAADKNALSRRMQSFVIKLAKAINYELGRKGKVFAYRYSAKQIKSRRYARNAIAYVLNNWRRHHEDFYENAHSKIFLDEYSSAVAFDGWTIKFGKPTFEYESLPVSPARTWLLREGWKQHGRIDPFEVPAAHVW
jgi:REP element-mobilizing transposase RayT